MSYAAFHARLRRSLLLGTIAFFVFLIVLLSSQSIPLVATLALALFAGVAGFSTLITLGLLKDAVSALISHRPPSVVPSLGPDADRVIQEAFMSPGDVVIGSRRPDGTFAITHHPLAASTPHKSTEAG